MNLKGIKRKLFPESFWLAPGISVTYRSDENCPDPEKCGWSINRNGSVWDETLKEWVYEPMPSHRDPEFLAATRFTLKDALKLATLI